MPLVRVRHYARAEAARALLDPTAGPSETDYVGRLSDFDRAHVEAQKQRVRELVARNRFIRRVKDTIGR